jgi:formamidopyrimidine-DNA glycosylase
MPELPEVESVRRGLVEHVIGAKIIRALQFHPRALSSASLQPLRALDDARILDVQRRGKFLWFVLDKRPLALVAHLGMSGQFIIEDVGALKGRHCRARFRLQRKSTREKGKAGIKSEFLLSFHDQRTFGWLRVDEIEGGLPRSVAHIARDIFDPEFDRMGVIKRLQGKQTEIKRALLDQSVMSGVGNIYADEALWRAKLHPKRLCSKIADEEYRALLNAIKSVMRRALREGGTSFDELYINVNGESGYFENSLEVYGREGEECSRCHHLIRRIKFTNRSSHYCAHCQPRR